MKGIGEKILSFAGTNSALGLFSVLFAAGLWFFVNAGQKAAERAVEVPLEFRNIPSDLMVVSVDQEQVEVRLMGPPALLSTMDTDLLKVVLDLDGMRQGPSTFRLSPDFFSPPRGVRITRISPSVVHVKLDSVAVRSVPVTVRLGGKTPFGYKVAQVEVNPETVRVRGPASEVDRMASVETVALDLEGKRGQVSRELRLAGTGNLLTFSPDRVNVSVVLEEEWMTKEFNRVEVGAKDFAGEYRVTPRSVYLRLSGPKRILSELKLGEQQTYLDLKGLAPGTHSLPLSFDLPSEVTVVEQKPNRFRVRIEAKAGGE